MAQQLKKGLRSVQEVYSNCAQQIQKFNHLNAYIRITKETSQTQFEDSCKRYTQGIKSL